MTEVKDVYGLIWLIIGISAAWLNSPYLFTQHPSEVENEKYFQIFTLAF